MCSYSCRAGDRRCSPLIPDSSVLGHRRQLVMKMAGICCVRSLVLLLIAAALLDLALARSLQQGQTNPGTAAAAALAVPGTVNRSSCVGPTTPAKYRFMWAYVMKRPSGLVQFNLEVLVNQWMTNCSNARTGRAVRFGHGPALTSDPAVYGRRTPLPANWVLADFAAWSDWVSLNDLTACLAMGVNSGVLGQIKNFAKASSEMVLPLTPQYVAGNPGQARKCPQQDALPPATVRYMVFNYIDTDPEVVLGATDAFKQISAATSEWIRSGVGPSAPAVSGMTLTGVGLSEDSAATFGSYRDFTSLAGLTADLTNPRALAFRKSLHEASLMSFHVALRVGAPDRPAEKSARPTPPASPLPARPSQKVASPAARAAATPALG